MTSRKPLRTRHAVLFWVAIVFVLLVTSTVGMSLIAEGMGGRRALAHGPVGPSPPQAEERSPVRTARSPRRMWS